jgi:selenocysteine lyase/cysteine desulfurase
MQVGLDWAHARTNRLARSARDGLGRIDGVTSPMPDADAVAGTVSFGIRGWPASLARDQLRRRAFALVGLTPAGDRLRVGIGCWNTDEEIDRFVRAVADLAATTPEDLPPRPPILVISDPT